MNNFRKILLSLILILCLVLIRGVLAPYFYDPLRNFFLNNFLQKPLPEINYPLYFLNLFFRYTLNAIFSILLIKVLFEDRNAVIFSIKFYVLAFIVLSALLFYLMNVNSLENDYRFLFYVRRFLIHPVFVIVLVPSFYYQKLQLQEK